MAETITEKEFNVWQNNEQKGFYSSEFSDFKYLLSGDIKSADNNGFEAMCRERMNLAWGDIKRPTMKEELLTVQMNKLKNLFCRQHKAASKLKIK